MLLKAVTACCRLCRYFCLPLNLLAAAALPLHAGAPARLRETLSCRKCLHRSQDSQVSGFPSLRLFLSWESSDICKFRAAGARRELWWFVVVVVEVFTLQSRVKE